MIVAMQATNAGSDAWQPADILRDVLTLRHLSLTDRCCGPWVLEVYEYVEIMLRQRFRGRS